MIGTEGVGPLTGSFSGDAWARQGLLSGLLRLLWLPPVGWCCYVQGRTMAFFGVASSCYENARAQGYFGEASTSVLESALRRDLFPSVRCRGEGFLRSRRISFCVGSPCTLHILRCMRSPSWLPGRGVWASVVRGLCVCGPCRRGLRASADVMWRPWCVVFAFICDVQLPG